MSETEYQSRLQEARARARALQNKASNAANQAKQVLSFGKKLKEHWPIMMLAVFFDLIGLIPYMELITSWGFALILNLYFSDKGKKSGSEGLLGIVLPTALGDAVAAVLSYFPVCIGAATTRIIMYQPEEPQPAAEEEVGADEPEPTPEESGEGGEEEGEEGGEEAEPVAMPVLKNVQGVQPVEFCSYCGAAVYSRSSRFCQSCGKPLDEIGFDPEAELKNIRRLPRVEQKNAMNRFKLQLAHQKEGVATVKRELMGRAMMFQDSTPDMLYNSVVHQMDRYNFSRAQRAAVRRGVDALQDKKNEVQRLLNDHRDPSTGQLDEGKIFESLFNFRPTGEVKMKVVGGGAMVAFEVNDIEDFARMSKRGETVNFSDIERAKMAGGWNMKSDFGKYNLSGSVIAENLSDGRTSDERIINHEVHHGINDIMNKAFDAEEENFQKEHKSLAKRASDFNENVSKGRNQSEFTEQELKEREGLVQDIQTNNRRARDYGFEKRVKDEISAYFTQDGYLPERLKETLMGSGAELYDYAYQHSSEKKQAGEKISKDYKRIVGGGIDAIQTLMDQGYSRKQANDLLFNEPLRNWPRVVERMVGRKKTV